MKLFCYAMLVMLSSVAVAVPEEPVEPAVVLKLNGTLTDPTAIDFEALPKLNGEHAVVCPVTDELKFQLHDDLIHHDGKYWCMFRRSCPFPEHDGSASSVWMTRNESKVSRTERVLGAVEPGGFWLGRVVGGRGSVRVLANSRLRSPLG